MGEDYNGWTNWETWHTALMIDNERDLYDKKVELVKKKASLPEFKRGLKRAESMSRKFMRENWKNEKFETVNWKEIYDNMMQEDYS